jgi:hypothetical protein
MAFLASYLVLLACCVLLRSAWSKTVRRRRRARRAASPLLLGAGHTGSAPPAPVRLAIAARARGYEGWRWGPAAEIPKAAPAVLTSLFVLLDLSQPLELAAAPAAGLPAEASAMLGETPLPTVFAEPSVELAPLSMAPLADPWFVEPAGGFAAQDGWFV